MLVGGDLGFPCLVVLLLLVVVVPVVGFVVRRKLVYAAARREEVKRLLVLASEEAARSELEPTEWYSYTASTCFPTFASARGSASVPLVSSLKPQYQCAVCFCPTTTRCAKCKAVHYCSSRCQIIHWRQGHKDDCRPYVALNPINKLGGSSYKQGDDKDYDDSFHTEGQQTATPVEKLAEGLHHEDDVGVECRAHRQGTNSTIGPTSDLSYGGNSAFSTPRKSSTEASFCSSSDSHREDICQFADATSDNFETVESKLQSLVSPAGSVKINQNKSNPSDEDAQSGSSSSSYQTDDGIDADDFAPSTSCQADNWKMADSRSSSNFLNGTVMNGFTATSTISDAPRPTTLGNKKSNYEITLSKEMPNDGLKSRMPPKSTSEILKHRGADVGIDLPKGESKISSSAVASQRASAAGEHSKLEDAKAFDGLPSSSSERHGSQGSKSVKFDDDKHRVATCSPQLTENPRTARNGLGTSMLKVVDQLKPSKLSRHCSSGGGIETSHRYSSKGLFSYEMFVELYNWKKVEMRPCGLINCGNSCYANAVLQCLAYTPPLTAYLLQGLHSKACDQREWCFACELEGLVMKTKGGSSPISPIRILSQIKNIGSNLSHGREEDAHEFLRYSIDTLQSVCLKEAGTNASKSLQEETTLIGLTFGGYLRSNLKCMKCGVKSEQHERMMDLTVEIEGDIGTLEEALNKFTCTEILDGENKYRCGRCKSYEMAKKKLTLLEAPNVLIIVLKRFQSGKFGKLNKSVPFPEILDMAPYVSGTSDKSPIYRLYGVVVHLDIMNSAFSGHYVCYVKNVQSRWFKVDDGAVKEVDLQSVLTEGAYMLLYARCSPRAPRAIRSLLIHHHDVRKHTLPASFKSRSHSTELWGSQPLVRHRSLEEESSSSSSDTSGFFSESCSCSTESSHRDSTSIEDHGDLEQDYWNSSSPSWSLSLSDSDTSSSSSFPSPLHDITTNDGSHVDHEIHKSREGSRRLSAHRRSY